MCQGAEIIGYVFPGDSVLIATDIAAKKLTRINYAFANIRNGLLTEGFKHDAQNLSTLNTLRAQNPKLKVLVSAGGWSWSGAFSDVALNKQSRSAFVESAVAFIQNYNLDGLDLDWEYPGLIGAGNKFRSEDKQNYTRLLLDLRHAFDRAGNRLQKRLYLSVAVGASANFIAHTEMARVAHAVDYVNLMSYDYYEPTDDKIAGHHAALYTNPADPTHQSADASVQLFLAAGVPRHKLILGVPFYGHAWKGAGLYQKAVGLHIPADFKNIMVSMTPSAGFIRYWDRISSVPYLYNSKTHVFVSYEDPQSLALKCTYVRSRKLGGIMFWDYEGDSGGMLLDTIYAELH